MGTGVSNLRAALPRPKNFNAANRAEKVIEKTQKGQILRVPPKHKTYADALRQFQKENPSLFETFGQEGLRKHEVLDQNLRSVFVTSTGDNKDLYRGHVSSKTDGSGNSGATCGKTEEQSEAKLQDGKWSDLYRKETDVPKGKINVARLLLLLQKHNTGERSSDLANEFNLSSVRDVDDITSFYSLYDVIVNRSDYEPYSANQEQITDGSDEKEFKEEFATTSKKSKVVLKPVKNL